MILMKWTIPQLRTYGMGLEILEVQNFDLESRSTFQILEELDLEIYTNYHGQ